MSVTYLNPQRGSLVEALEYLLGEAKKGNVLGFIAVSFPKDGTPFRTSGGEIAMTHIPYAITAMECEKARMVDVLNDYMDSQDDNEPSPGLTS